MVLITLLNNLNAFCTMAYVDLAQILIKIWHALHSGHDLWACRKPPWFSTRSKLVWMFSGRLVCLKSKAEREWKQSARKLWQCKDNLLHSGQFYSTKLTIVCFNNDKNIYSYDTFFTKLKHYIFMKSRDKPKEITL